MVYGSYVAIVLLVLWQSVAFALWGLDGGLATFRLGGASAHAASTRDRVSDVSDEHQQLPTPASKRAPPMLTEVGRLALPALARANRVHVHGAYAWLPLEQSPGAIAAVNVSDPANPTLAVGPIALVASAPADGLGAVGAGATGARRRADGSHAQGIAKPEHHSHEKGGGSTSTWGDTCYCLAVHGKRLYAFAASSATLFVFGLA